MSTQVGMLKTTLRYSATKFAYSLEVPPLTKFEVSPLDNFLRANPWTHLGSLQIICIGCTRCSFAKSCAYAPARVLLY